MWCKSADKFGRCCVNLSERFSTKLERWRFGWANWLSVRRKVWPSDMVCLPLTTRHRCRETGFSRAHGARRTDECCVGINACFIPCLLEANIPTFLYFPFSLFPCHLHYACTNSIFVWKPVSLTAPSCWPSARNAWMGPCNWLKRLCAPIGMLAPLLRNVSFSAVFVLWAIGSIVNGRSSAGDNVQHSNWGPSTLFSRCTHCSIPRNGIVCFQTEAMKNFFAGNKNCCQFL